MYLKTYYPIPRFPPISLSGTRCELHCAHCEATYLSGMMPAETPEDLLRVCKSLEAQGGLGALLSGGSDREGRILNLALMLDGIRAVKAETNLILNLHPGLLAREVARGLAVDFVSLEIPDEDIIHNVFGLEKQTQDYLQTYRFLRDAGLEVVPHITVYKGDEHQLLQDVSDPQVVVVIVFSPTKGTHMGSLAPPSPTVVARVIARVKEKFPSAEIALGCMRPRQKGLREDIEMAALDAGVTRMELPARKTLAYARTQGYDLRQFDTCCGLPSAYEAQLSKA